MRESRERLPPAAGLGRSGRMQLKELPTIDVDRNDYGQYKDGTLMPSRMVALIGCLALCCAAFPSGAAGQGFGGQLNYTGALRPVGSRRPLCVCVYSDAAFKHRLGCLITSTNNMPYEINTRDNADYYVVAFLDLHINERLEADEPFEIYHDRAAPPGDPISGSSGRTDVDLVFGDENLPSIATATATATATGSIAPTPTKTPLVPVLAGDCDHSGAVTVEELIRAVKIALGEDDLSTCTAADTDGDGVLRVDELIRAVYSALHSAL